MSDYKTISEVLAAYKKRQAKTRPYAYREFFPRTDNPERRKPLDAGEGLYLVKVHKPT